MLWPMLSSAISGIAATARVKAGREICRAAVVHVGRTQREPIQRWHLKRAAGPYIEAEPLADGVIRGAVEALGGRELAE